METLTANQQAVLSRIESRFLKYRRAHGGKQRLRYPEGLKVLALSALREGLKPAEIARVSGVTPKTIGQWRDAKTLPLPARELEIVEGRSHQEHESLARIRFTSGILMEIPVSSLAVNLLRALNGGGEQ